MKDRSFYYFQILIILLAFAVVSVAFLYLESDFKNYSIQNITIILLAMTLGMILSLLMIRSLTNKIVKEKKESNVNYQDETDINDIKNVLKDDRGEIEKEQNGVETKRSIEVNILDTQTVLKEERSGIGKEQNSVETKINIDVNILDAQTAFLKMEERLLCELKALEKRSNINLIIGSVIAVIGWVLLFWFIYEIGGQETEGWRILNTFLPRLSIVAIMEVFSFFFLKLYRESIERIRYYQNEITNIEAKKVAIIVACMSDNENSNKKEIINSLLSVERNIFIKKGETTMELEKYRIDNSFNSNLIKSLKELGIGLIQNRKEVSQS